MRARDGCRVYAADMLPNWERVPANIPACDPECPYHGLPSYPHGHWREKDAPSARSRRGPLRRVLAWIRDADASYRVTARRAPMK